MTAAAVAVGLILSLGGCALPGLPTQKHPVCSWASQPPANSQQLCTRTFNTLASLVAAERSGDDRTVHDLVSNSVVARRIIAFGAKQRTDHVTNLHAVPDLTLEVTSRGHLGAGFYILGNGRKGQVNAPQTVYLQLHHGKAIVVGDQPNQDW